MNLRIPHVPPNWNPFDEWSFIKWHRKLKEEYPMPELLYKKTKK